MTVSLPGSSDSRSEPPAHHSQPLLTPRTRLGRYEILATLGTGGMGEVYRARDLRLMREVAVKILPRGLAADSGRVLRFEREARAASALNHPNIVSVYDVGNNDGISFIVSELVEGKTLADLLAAGPMPRDLVFELAIQLTDALEAAHAKGIVHRDVKPSNIIVTPRGQAKILDFGIAKVTPSAQDQKTETLVTMPGEAMGTLSYMSPEQARGDDPDPRTDLFSLGAVLYEMATGRRAFSGRTPALVYAAILHDQPPAIPGALGKVIARALQKDRDARWPSAAEMRSALWKARGEPAVHTGFKDVPRLALILILLLDAALGGTLWFTRAHRAPVLPAQTASPPAKVRRSVAVLGFKNLTGKPDASWLSAALSEMLASELAAGETLRTIPGENVARAKIDLSLPDADGYGRQTLSRIYKTLGADYVVLGTYYYAGKDAGGAVRLDLRLQDSRSGDTVTSLSNTGTDAQLLALVTSTGMQLRSRLGVAETTATQQTAVRAELPANPEAYRLYSEGLNRLRLYDSPSARDLLVKAAAAEPSNAMIHSALGQAWRSLGYVAKAQSEGKQAMDLADGLSREKRLLIEARYHEAKWQWEKAAEAYETLFRFFPDNLDYGLQLIMTQRLAGQGKEGRATAAILRKLPPPASDDPRIDIQEGAAADALGDYREGQRLFTSAIQKGEAQGAGLLVAKARLSLGWDMDRLGQLPQAPAVLEQARDVFARAGDNESLAQTLLTLAAVRYDQGDLQGADRLYTEASAAYRRSGNQRGLSHVLGSRGNIYYEQGKLPIAKKLYEEALALDREIGSKADTAGELGNIANVLDGEGDLAGARKMQQEALENFQAVGDKRGESSTYDNLGLVLDEQGDLAGAKSAHEQALRITAQTGYRRGQAYSLMGLGQVQMERGDLKDARAKLEEARSIRHAMGDELKVAASRVALAELDLEEGQAPAAVTLLDGVMESFHKEKSEDEECEAYATLARALAAQKQIAAARTAVQKARGLVKSSSAPAMNFVVTLAEADVSQAAGSPPEEIRRSLVAALSQAVKHGYLGFAYRIRLALAEIDLRRGDANARTALQSLESEARGKGYLLIAQRIQALCAANGACSR